jgi:drug/metabolite transporter (DMT)-like permease
MMSIKPPSHRILGILIASIATIFFAILDTSGKWLVQSFPVIEVVWIRFAVHMLLALISLIYAEGFKKLLIEDMWLHALRSAMLCTMTALNFYALQYLQLAQTAAILFSSPIIIALISSFVHHERLTLVKWFAVIAGFFGVLIILDPFGYHFHPAMLLVLAHATIFAFFNFLWLYISIS